MGLAYALGFGWLYTICYGLQPALFADAFPAEVRFTGMSLGYQLANVVGSGFTPMIAVWLVHSTGNFHAVPVFVAITLAVSLVCLLRLAALAQARKAAEELGFAGEPFPGCHPLAGPFPIAFEEKEIMKFEHITLGQRVLFGAGRAAEHVAQEAARLGARNIMCITSEFERPFAETALSLADVALWHTDVVQHVPAETADKARKAASDAGIDLIVCVGGGSTTGLAKAVALTTGIPIVAVPTTYAGSEATNVWGLTEDATKTTGVDDRVLPAAVVYDAELTLSLPVALSVASGLNALAHCVDSLWAPRADPINQALAAEGIRALADGLPRIAADPTDLAGPRDCPVRGVPRRRVLRLRGFGAAPQDLPRPGRNLQPAPRGDARDRPPLRGGLQWTRGSRRGRTARRSPPRGTGQRWTTEPPPRSPALNRPRMPWRC